MGRYPRGRVLLVTIAASVVTIVGVGAALAQSDDATLTGSSPEDLLARLDALEPDLPGTQD